MRYFLECGFEVVASPEQVVRWNNGKLTKDDLRSIKIHVPAKTEYGFPSSDLLTINECDKKYNKPDWLEQEIQEEDEE